MMNSFSRQFFLGVLIVFTSVSSYPDTAIPDTNSSPDSLATLLNTDGTGLFPKPPAFTKKQLDQFFAEGKQACNKDCVTDFGTSLGVADGVKGLSNCRSMCINPEYSFLNLETGEFGVHKDDPKKKNLHYIGVVYQCVEYARRWWMKNRGITFGSVDGANEVIYLKEGINIRTGKTFPLARSINGTAKRPPEKGDLLVYYPLPDNPKWRWGHVAVITDVDLDKGIISLAEQNITNAKWENPSAYARQVRIFKIADRYRVLDVPINDNINPAGALIAGWVYPAD